MKYRYTKYRPEDLDDLNLEDLLSRLSDTLLGSGFEDPYGLPGEDDGQSMQALHEALLEAILSGAIPDDMLEKLLGKDWQTADDAEERIDELVDRIIQKLQQQGYITPSPDLSAEQQHRQGGGQGRAGEVRFEITDKSLDFLGYRALRDLMGSIGKSSIGRHDTREMATGIEASGASKPYEFGDTMNLDPAGTVLNAVRRGTLDVDYEDLMVTQGEYQSSCATVLMLDCSHSMILYGEDRFTPAKRVALALANLVKLQYPGDALKCVLFHDSAEEIPMSQLARVRVGPYYTNTREGLRLARRILERQQKDMRQIVMITDGKPSALTRPDGHIYRNAFGLDPFIVSETFAEVAACRKAGIMINTFMLARDPDLIAFVRKVAQICHGKAYFTTPRTLGRYVLMDYMDNKSRTIH
ncbi:MAG: VWA domain-containing protein [Acidobacteriota bacterium]|nr:VWA domain-containing protein [Acidobacteriota bacterium]MDQ3417176.1 VWA domain-containing protein [Acidobacteriota bacterium]